VFISHASKHCDGACDSYSRLSFAVSSCIISVNIILHGRVTMIDLSMMKVVALGVVVMMMMIMTMMVVVVVMIMMM